MAVLNRNPWGDRDNSFEQMGQVVAKPIKKAVGDTVKAVATDVRQQVTGDYGQAVEQAQEEPQAKQVQQVQQAQQAQLTQTRQNLEQINQAIKKVRQEKAKQVQQTQQADVRHKEQKKQLEEKKKEEPVWKKMLAGKTGSKEAHQRTAG